MNIKGKVVTLRALEPRDMEALRSYHNDPEVASLIVGWSFPISSVDQMKWYERVSAESTNKRFAVDAPEAGFIGISTLTNIDLKYRSAVHGVMIGPRNLRGKGYGTDTVMATMRYAFEELGLERLDTEIVDFNEPSIKLYTNRCGWVVEGKRRHSVFRGNRWHDSFVVGVLRDDYLRLIQETQYWA